MKSAIKHWARYRWAEGKAITTNHPNYTKDMENHIICISKKLSAYRVYYRLTKRSQL